MFKKGEKVMVVDSFRSATASLEPYVDSIVAGKFLGLLPVTVMRLARQGHLPGHPERHTTRRQWRFLLSALSSWLARRTGTT